MKRLIFTLFLLCVPVVAFASPEIITVFTNASTVGAFDDAVWVRDKEVKDWTCDMDITGSPSAVTVRIEGNMGGTTYDPTGMAEHVVTATQLTAGKASFGIANSSVVNMRGNLVVLTGGSSPKVTGVCGGNPLNRRGR